MSPGFKCFVLFACFRCQMIGHVADQSKAKPRCVNCAGKHEYGGCAAGAKLKCKYGGEHRLGSAKESKGNSKV